MFCTFSVVKIALAFIQVLPTRGQDCKCGTPSDSIVSMRIVGGRRAEPHSFPWTVAIWNMGSLYCGGSLITNKHILSAGHCFIWSEIELMGALIGLDNLTNLKGVQQRGISKAVVHEGFAGNSVRDVNDIAVATLDSPVILNDYVVPVCLPKPNEEFAGRMSTIVGWGKIGNEQEISKVLLKASLRIVDDATCMRSDLSRLLRPTMMCAFSKGKDGCQGDSGGPLIVYEPVGRFVQAGIVSWGIGCADPHLPGVYTKVSKYLDWIKRHTVGGTWCN